VRVNDLTLLGGKRDGDRPAAEAAPERQRSAQVLESGEASFDDDIPF
jgi:hypothetical protein